MATYASKLRRTGVDNATVMLDSQGRLVSGVVREPFHARDMASVYYADGNVVSSGDGRTWDTAFKTLAEGLAACHTYMSTSANRAWAQRATLYCCADNFTEDITTFAEKTDIIGVGTTNQHPRPRIEGTHVLVAITSDTYHGCRWFNVEWYGAAAGIIVDIPANQNGQEFHNCVWSSVDAATIGLRAVQSHDMTIKNCWFDPNTSGTGFSTAAIQINAGSVTNFLLEGSRIFSAGIGLDFNPTAGQPINCWVIENFLATTGLAIDEESDDLWIVNNRWMCESLAAGSSYDLDVKHAVGNIATGSDVTDWVPFTLAT